MNEIESSPPKKKNNGEDIVFDDDDEDANLTYEQKREKTLRENMDMFNLFGVNQAAQNLADCLKKTPLAKKSTSLKRKIEPNNISTPRRSLRLANMPANESIVESGRNLPYELRALQPMNYAIDDKDSESNPEVNEESIPLPERDLAFFDKLNADLVSETAKDSNTCDFYKFTKDLRSLVMTEPSFKVVDKRIYSLAIHSSETSLIVAAGDQRGHIGFYNKNDSDLRQYRVHNAPVNCISFCSWDPFKLFSTSHDGSVRCGDLNKRTFDVIHCSGEDNVKRTHATWHTEYERNLLVGNGSGHVNLIDPRTPNKINNSAWCHQRSVRTVHCHPVEKHLFLTSSGLGEVHLWDIRKMTNESIEPVLLFAHPKSLTSAFFSASGTKMVSTCNDDMIRIFNTSKLNVDATKPVEKIQHDNHTGRWLSVFKAKWHPGRDDAFFIGSMQLPKRIQIYRADGDLLHNLTSENMATYCPVIEVHPTQNIYIGGNSSGRLHIFSN